MALLNIVYERLLSAIHNENTLDLYFTLGRKLGRVLYEGKWFDPEAMLLKDGLTRWIAPSISGSVKLELIRGADETSLRVTDSGPGISNQEQEAVLRRFYRSDKIRNTPGVGLGLNPPVFLKAGDVVELGIDGLGESRQNAIAFHEASAAAG